MLIRRLACAPLLSKRWSYCRRSGEALSPEREPLHVLDALKLQLGSDAFSAQYQQAPAPPGGAMVKRHWIKRYSELPPASARLFTLQSWDTASRGGPDNDWSVCTTWIVTRNKLWYLIDVWRQRVRPHNILILLSVISFRLRRNSSDMSAGHLQNKVGHFGVFNGSRFRNEIVPRIREFHASI